ncbi:uncharacterized protein EKO05_0000520 [Ascochyta rabiei]|uniref:Protein disulfide oxidoreductase n=1 Tax=Didymella rabiei TaxID=5454 RepID=A0A163HQU4_DIDRA|nr:uncharacterized protein EKO05_0000520 [Ascochyta rabiei]KZM25418.1 protein disulfide oxidoreductase [Ascochyta rabiei]UPX09839.1 hypothetical protein EKO05_0000520 [Ascochyta rabiei]
MSEPEDQPQQLINGTLKPLIGMDSKSTIPVIKSKAEYLKAVMYEGVTILEGTATWCQQCKVIAPEVAKLVEEYPDVKFYLYDVEECEDIAHELGVRSMPTFSIFKDGDIQDGVTGAKPKEIRKAIEACL